MSSREKIDSLYGFTDKALVELKAWLEPWFLDQEGETVEVEGPSFAEAVATLAATRSLVGYWRLGESASPFADTSGNTGGPFDMTLFSGTYPMSVDITGALPAADDDGAVAFNAFASSEYLHGDDDPSRFNFDSTAFTVAAWLKPAAGSTTHPTTAVGVFLNEATYGSSGWRLGVNYPALTPFFQRRRANLPHTETVVTGAAMAADNWYFVVGTYDPTGGHKLYVNGDLVDSDATTFTGIPEFTQGLWFAYGVIIGTSGTLNFYNGGLDEVSIWGEALTVDEIGTLYRSGVGVAPGAGSAWYHGAGTPSSALGDDTSYYLDTATGDIWFKSSGAWSMIWDAP